MMMMMKTLFPEVRPDTQLQDYLGPYICLSMWRIFVPNFCGTW